MKLMYVSLLLLQKDLFMIYLFAVDIGTLKLLTFVFFLVLSRLSGCNI